MNVDSMISRKLPIGIQNFEKLHTEGYFSNLNQLQDISLHPAYTTPVSYTHLTLPTIA